MMIRVVNLCKILARRMLPAPGAARQLASADADGNFSHIVAEPSGMDVDCAYTYSVTGLHRLLVCMLLLWCLECHDVALVVYQSLLYQSLL